MGFRFVAMGQKVVEKPVEAAEELSAEMRANGANMGVVAAKYGVHRDTFARWLDQLEAAGYAVEGRGTAKKGRKPGPAKKGGEAKQAAGRGRVRRSGAPLGA